MAQTILSKITSFLKKHKYAFLVLSAGIGLMLIPENDSAQVSSGITPQVDNILSVEEKLSEVLSQIQGAGEVVVLLTEAFGEETIYQVDRDTSQSDSSSSLREDTITITDSQRNEQGLVKQQNPPKYMGAVVVCQGGDKPTVRLAIIDAISKLTGLGADKISVLKMK